VRFNTLLPWTAP